MYFSPISQPQLAPQARKESDQSVTSLRDRLKALSAHDDEEEAAQAEQTPIAFKTPEETRFLDVTAAFFSRPISHPKSRPIKKAATPLIPRAPISMPHPRGGREQQQQRERAPQSPPRSFNVSESPDARDLIEAVAAQSNHLFDEGITKLGELDKSLRSIQADTTNRDNKFLDRVQESTRKYCKPLSDTQVLDDSVDNVGVVNRKSVHVGERIAFVKGRLATLEAEIDSLWNQWEDAQREVDVVFAELIKRDGEGTPNEPGSKMAVKASLAREVSRFEKELEGILDDAHEEARAFEKDFSKSIQAVQHTFLQGYLLE